MVREGARDGAQTTSGRKCRPVPSTLGSGPYPRTRAGTPRIAVPPWLRGPVDPWPHSPTAPQPHSPIAAQPRIRARDLRARDFRALEE
ncbi:hypothetical protein GCM10009578_035170 [Streptomyces rhizosphaericus]